MGTKGLRLKPSNGFSQESIEAQIMWWIKHHMWIRPRIGWWINDHSKVHAHHIIREAKNQGIIMPCPCEVCGTMDHIVAHHDDYSKPLEVRWLCRGHHKKHHTEIVRKRNDEIARVFGPRVKHFNPFNCGMI